MKANILIILSIFVFAILQQDITAQTLEEGKTIDNHQLKVKVEKLRNSNGNVVIKLLDKEEQVVDSLGGKVQNNAAEFIFKNIKPGIYTLLYYHDENENGDMDKNFIGMPKEGYGFSNNAEGRFGPPALEKRLFKIESDTAVVLYPFYH